MNIELMLHAVLAIQPRNVCFSSNSADKRNGGSIQTSVRSKGRSSAVKAGWHKVRAAPPLPGSTREKMITVLS